MSGGFLALQQKKTKEKRKFIDLEDAFKEADTNHDGKLSFEEWCAVLTKTGHENPRYVNKVEIRLTFFPKAIKLFLYL